MSVPFQRSLFALAGTSLAVSTVATGQFISQCRLENGGFETLAYTPGLPTTHGIWASDQVQFVGAEQGITPVEGAQMVRCLGMDAPGGFSATSVAMFQLVDLSSCIDKVQSGRAVVTASANFNRVTGTFASNRAFYVSLFAFEGPMATFPTQYWQSAHLTHVDMNLISDADPGTWEVATARLCIPPDTDFVAILVGATEDVSNNSSALEFEGHYIDDVTLSVGVPDLAVWNYCASAPNSVSPGARISASGSTHIANADFQLVADGCPPGVPGIFFYTGADVGAPATTLFGNGFRCIEGQSFRLSPLAFADSMGSATLTVDFASLPAGGQIAAYTTWFFQYWYRDSSAGGAGFNLTDGLGATFCP